MVTRRLTSRACGIVASVAILLALTLGSMGTAFADSPAPSTSVSGGSLTETAGTVTITNPTLTGSNQLITMSIPLELTDLTGTGAGWHVTITSTSFANGSHTLDAPLCTGVALNSTTPHDGNGTYTDPALTSLSGAIPAGASAPTAASLTSAAATSGMGKFNLDATFTISLPSNAYSGTYSSTITLAVVTGP